MTAGRRTTRSGGPGLALLAPAAERDRQTPCERRDQCPAFIDNPMLERLLRQYPEHKEPIVARHPIGRLDTVEEEVAKAVVWLCSDVAAFITGQVLAVDGGYVVQ